ncbi:LacI family DNA-binding transcriptional regulator [Aureimonas sp. AU40]|uniref:LacI family DNA-binding transcriptional regulator n=1 Tax=Aureimonas sp. AU40 TaxID=1637747 RepID=UPI0007813500|nr:LacI family DNA-binding transcriptional regulator [Aureimonas sp. AU40]
MTLPRPPRKSATVADVARAAGVSKATAARVLGGYGTVSFERRAAILAAAERLDYRPNELARTMATGRSGTIGVVVGDIENPFFGSVVRGISDEAKARGFGVLLSNSGEDVAEEQDAVSMLVNKRVDGLIVAPASSRDKAHLTDALSLGLPLVLVDREADGLDLDAAIADHRDAARRAMRLLVAKGHRRIAYVTASHLPGPRFAGVETIGLTTVRQRIEGFLAEAEAAALPDPARFLRFGASSRAAASEVLSGLLKEPQPPSAILASDSVIAIEVLRTAKALGLRIPGDLSLVTFDDAGWMSAASPTVTVLAQPSHALGSQAMRMLAERIAGRAEAERLVLPSELIERESVAAPAD